MAQGCAETGAMQAVAKQSDIVSNGRENRNSPRFGPFATKGPKSGELMCD